MTPYYFAIFRILLGIYLSARFFYQSPSNIYLLPLGVLAVLLALGVARQNVCALIGLGLVVFAKSDSALASYAIDWLLLALVFIPEGEPLRLPWYAKRHPRNLAWTLHNNWRLAALGLLAFGYMLMSMQYLLLDNLFITALAFVLGPLCLYPRTRMGAWAIGLALQVLLGNFGMVLLHLFTFDEKWFPANTSIKSKNPTIFYDGLCGFCDGFVSFILDVDVDGIFKLSPLQGETAAQLLPSGLREDLKTVVYRNAEGELLTKSNAVLAIFKELGGIWFVLSILRFVPGVVRDGVYTLIARYRYAIFGKLEACRMPSDETRARFLP